MTLVPDVAFALAWWAMVWKLRALHEEACEQETYFNTWFRKSELAEQLGMICLLAVPVWLFVSIRFFYSFDALAMLAFGSLMFGWMVFGGRVATAPKGFGRTLLFSLGQLAAIGPWFFLVTLVNEPIASELPETHEVHQALWPPLVLTMSAMISASSLFWVLVSWMFWRRD